MTDVLLPALLSGIDKIRLAHGSATSVTDSKTISVEAVLAALDSFTEIVRYLNTRRTDGAVLELTSEAKIQDALYMMLRPWILDLVPESPAEKVANRFTIKDFFSKTGRFVIEVKYIRNVDHGKHIAKELNDDIENYRYHPNCDDLILFIFDPDANIPDAGAVHRHIHSQRVYDGKILRCHGVIKP